MPQGDKTGPNGEGPMTGRRMGFCSGSNSPGFMSNCFRRGTGFGRRGRFFQQTQPLVITEKQEKQYLEQELETLKEETKEIEKRLKELKN